MYYKTEKRKGTLINESCIKNIFLYELVVMRFKEVFYLL